MPLYTIALFGETEKGEFRFPHFCTSLDDLVERFGNPPPHTHGLYLAIQALLYERRLIFFRVREEGFSTQDYLYGLHYLKERPSDYPLCALCLPGVGDHEIIDASRPVCSTHKSLLILSEADFFDYITATPHEK
jgi:hypothetical protein